MSKKRNLSGILIFSKRFGKREPVCIEEALPEEQYNWLNSLEKEALVRTCIALMETMNEMAEATDITRHKPEQIE